jgi:hypothetical protein
MFRIMASIAVVALLSAGAAQAESAGAVKKLYAQHAQGLAERNIDKMWEIVDPECAFPDEKGQNRTAAEMRRSTQEFFSQTRNATMKHKLKETRNAAGKMVVRVEVEIQYERNTGNVFQEEWTPQVLSEVLVDTWAKKGKSWKIVESKTVSMDTQKKDSPTASSAAPKPKKAKGKSKSSASKSQASATH